MRLLPWVPLLALLLGGCAGRGRVLARRSEGHYATGSPRSEGWQPVPAGGADQAWWNGALGGSIYTDSNCGSRFEDGKLSTLADRLFQGLTSTEEVMEETFQLDARDAMLVVRKGRLDGVWIQVGAVVVNKDRCTYDMVYVASPERWAAGDADFRAVYMGFRTGSSP